MTTIEGFVCKKKHREYTPLKQAEDAIPVDTSGETLEQSVARMKEIVYKKLSEE